MVTKKTKINNEGFALLFVMVLVSIILAISIGVTDIALNEVNFSTSAQSTNDAFFAADTGAECALYWDKGLTVNDPFPASITCNNKPMAVSSGAFTILGLGNTGQACAIVTISKNPAAVSPASPTTVISKGYNNGGTGLCGDTPNYVERELDVTY
jgi:hypothetical protein